MQKTKELFDNWNIKKQELENFSKINKKIQIGEIWICNIGINIGSEISKDGNFLRPVLIVGNYMGADLVGIIPITTKYNENYKNFLVEIKNYKKYGLSKQSYLSLNNFKTVSKKRLIYKINNIYRLKKYFKLINKNFIEENLIKIINLNLKK